MAVKNIKISNNVIRRMPRYLRKLDELSAAGVERISSNELGQLLGLTPSQIRQDFSCFGEFGQQGYGYNLVSLRQSIAKILGMDRNYSAVVIGVGHLGHALVDHFDFGSCGFSLKAAFDLKEDMGGKVPVYEFTSLGDFCATTPIDVAVVCVPMDHAQEATDAAVKAGVKAIWNFTNAVLEVPDGIIKEDIYFSDSLLALEYYLAEMLDEEEKKAAKAK